MVTEKERKVEKEKSDRLQGKGKLLMQSGY